MRFHVYNGLNYSQCDMSGFSLQYDDNGLTTIPLKFTTDGPLIPEESINFVPQNINFMVNVPSAPVDCGNMKVDFTSYQSFTFTGPPKEHVVRN